MNIPFVAVSLEIIVTSIPVLYCTYCMHAFFLQREKMLSVISASCSIRPVHVYSIEYNNEKSFSSNLEALRVWLC